MIAPGPDGNLWFSEYNATKIGRIPLAGQITQFTLPDPMSNPVGLCSGPDDTLWFAESAGNRIGRLSLR
jgi:virginiamycin B lyase